MKMDKIAVLYHKVKELEHKAHSISTCDLKLSDEQIESAKTELFGYLYFHPSHCPEIQDSLIAVSKDGTLHHQHVRKVFTDTNISAQMIQCGSAVFRFIPKNEAQEVEVARYDNIMNNELRRSRHL